MAKICPFCSTRTVVSYIEQNVWSVTEINTSSYKLMIVMHLVVVQYKASLQEAQVFLNFKQEHKYMLIVAIKKGKVNDNV